MAPSDGTLVEVTVRTALAEGWAERDPAPIKTIAAAAQDRVIARFPLALCL